MASPRIRLNSQQEADFLAICALHVSQLEAAIAVLDGDVKRFCTTSELREAFTPHIGEENARALLRQLIGFAIGVRREAISDTAIGAISSALGELGWTSDQVEKWRSISRYFWAGVRHKAIRHAAKAFDLSFDYAILFNSARIITDFRPVFDDGHSEVIGGIIRHVFRLACSGMDGVKSYSIVVDRKDIESLRQCCDEAIKKEDALSSFMRQPTALDTIIPGEERDDLA